MFSKNEIMRQGLSLTAAAAMLIAIGVHAAKAESKDVLTEKPVQTTATFSDWTVRCRSAQEQDKTLCEMIQIVPAKNQQGSIANLAVGRMPGDENVRLVVQLPIGVHLPADVNIKIGDTDIARAEFQSCFTNFCLARAELDEAAIGKMKDAAKMTMSFQDRAQRDASLEISLKGFTAAHDATFKAGS